MRLLFAEDDRDLSRAVTALMERFGYTVENAYDGPEALECATHGNFDGIVMDWMMPGMDGITVLKTLRQMGNKTPCLILTARESVLDRITGLDSGADDYLVKPFDVGELMARLRAMLRRGDSWQPDEIRFADLVLNRNSMELSCHDKTVRLTAKTFQILELLMRDPGVYSAERIMDRVWSWNSDAEVSVVCVTISSLRKKLAEVGSCVRITSIRGAGYTLEATE